MIRQLISMTIASAFFYGMLSTAFAAGGGDVVTSDLLRLRIIDPDNPAIV